MGEPLPMAEPLVVVDGVVKRYGADTVLDRVGLSVASGQVMVVIGPSGSVRHFTAAYE